MFVQSSRKTTLSSWWTESDCTLWVFSMLKVKDHSQQFSQSLIFSLENCKNSSKLLSNVVSRCLELNKDQNYFVCSQEAGGTLMVNQLYLGFVAATQCLISPKASVCLLKASTFPSLLSQGYFPLLLSLLDHSTVIQMNGQMRDDGGSVENE